jgi:hypothetical protein
MEVQSLLITISRINKILNKIIGTTKKNQSAIQKSIS